MIQSLGNKLSQLSERYVPEPFVLAVLLTLLTLVLAAVFGEAVAGLSFDECGLRRGTYFPYFTPLLHPLSAGQSYTAPIKSAV